MSKHFELTDETINHKGRTLHRIRATRNLPIHDVKAGDLGGYVENSWSVSNNAWVGDSAYVFDNARLYGNALVSDAARVGGYARVSGNAWVDGNARVSGNAEVYNDAMLMGNARVSGSAHVFGNARVYDKAHATGKAQVFGKARVEGEARLTNKARVDNDKHIMIGTLHTTHRNHWTLHRTNKGHILHIGCKSGTLDDHQTICNSDSWIDSNNPEIIRTARSEYQAIIDLCRTRVAHWNH